MKKKLPAIFLFSALILCSCGVRGKNSPLIILPDANNQIENNNFIGIDEIIETRNGEGNANLPGWLLSYNNGGNEAVEKMEQYYGKYCFVGRNEGYNFEALTSWADNYSETNAFTRLAAARIEKRLNFKIALYPDDEYGSFYEKFVKKSYDTEYTGASAEDTFWIKKPGTSEANGFQDIYEFFVFISIDKTIMQDIVKKMMMEANKTVNPTRAQNNAINNIQLHFFEGF